MINKIITLDSNDKYLIFTKETIENNEFLIGIKIVNDKYVNDFKIFIETKKENEIYLEEITDESLINIIVNSYIIDKLKGE